MNRPSVFVALCVATLLASVAEIGAQDLAREHVLDLPEDSHAWQTVVVYDANPPTGASARLAQLLNTHPALAKLRQQTKFFEYTPNDWWTRRNVTGAPLPVLILQRPQGNVGKRVYKASGDNLPLDGDQLAVELQRAIDDCCPNPYRPPQPQPNPNPYLPWRPDQTPHDRFPLVPDLRPNDAQPAGELDTTVVLLIAAAAGAGLLAARKTNPPPGV